MRAQFDARLAQDGETSAGRGKKSMKDEEAFWKSVKDAGFKVDLHGAEPIAGRWCRQLSSDIWRPKIKHLDPDSRPATAIDDLSPLTRCAQVQLQSQTLKSRCAQVQLQSQTLKSRQEDADLKKRYKAILGPNIQQKRAEFRCEWAAKEYKTFQDTLGTVQTERLS